MGFLKRPKVILMAHPVGDDIPAWWPKDAAGDPDWVTVRADGQGWTSGEDSTHAISPKLVEENIEIFMFGFLDIDEDEDEDEDAPDVFAVEFEFEQVKIRAGN